MVRGLEGQIGPSASHRHALGEPETCINGTIPPDGTQTPIMLVMSSKWRSVDISVHN